MKKLLFILTLILSGLLWYVMVPAAPTPSAGRPPLMESFSYPYLGKKLPRPLRLCYLAYHMKDVAKERIDKSDWVSLDNMPFLRPSSQQKIGVFIPTSASIPVPSCEPCSSIFSTTKSPKAAVL